MHGYDQEFQESPGLKKKNLNRRLEKPLIESDEEGCQTTSRDRPGAWSAEGFDCVVDGSGEGLQEGTLLELAFLKGDEESCTQTLANAETVLEGPVDG